MKLGDYLKAQTWGIRLVAQCTGMTVEDFQAAGADPTTATDLATLVRVYFGPVRAADSPTQAAAREHAANQGHTLATLTNIERLVRPITKDHTWQLRALLCSLPAAEHEAAAADFRGPSKQSNPERGVRMTRRANGNHTMSITDTPQSVADMYGVLTAQAQAAAEAQAAAQTQAAAEAQAAAGAQAATAQESLPGLDNNADPDHHGSHAAAAGSHSDTAADPNTAGGQANADLSGSNTADQNDGSDTANHLDADHHDGGDGGDPGQVAGRPYRPSPVDLVDAAHTIFFGTDDNDNPVPHAARPQVRTNVIIRLEDLDKIIHGHGEEITVELTNGARMTGAQLVARKLAEIGLITLVHPFTGPVNLYTARSASYKQRLMAWAEHPTCA
ncbi:hypothetical protein [Corynebacterium lizhenjunii]|uniref:hypothetical protein n=1 Tax=Corynebacterium lizhenjunii TaxID=2709394 RepID=UPI001F293DDE|nr:hypothetical protein [Corynebacterium lizhenjunii]